VSVKPKTREKSDRKNDAQRGYMRSEAQGETAEPQRDIHQLMPYNEIINNEIQDPVEHHVRPTASGVSEQLS